MGVPSLFRVLASKYPETNYWDSKIETDHLYFDYNCLIHQCRSNIIINDQMSEKEIEEEMISEVCKYTCKIISIVKPRKLIYIAIDGPVPMGKMNKQRERRYKKVLYDDFYEITKKKWNVKESKKFDGNKITPGTIFMSKLCCRLRTYINMGIFNKHKTKDFKVFFSDSNISGEGESKIMDFIRNSKGGYNKKVIYGMDADLIILSLQINQGDTKLFRETLNMSTEMAKYHDCEFLFFDINVLKEKLLEHYKLQMYDHERIMNDILFLSFLGGNDFVEPLPHTKVRESGFEILLTAYTDCVKTDYLTSGTTINFDCFKSLLYKLSLFEDKYVKKNAHKNKTFNTLTPKGLKKDMELFEHSFYSFHENPMHKQYNNICKQIDFKCDDWKYQYNTVFFKDYKLKDVVHNYIQSLIWTLNYYHNNILTWGYLYNYRVAPCSTDIVNILENTMFNHTFQAENEMTPVEQLLNVVPPQSAYLLPNSYKLFIKENKFDSYPHNVHLDALKGQKNIYSEPILPKIDKHLINTIMKMLPVTENEKQRDVLKTRLYCFKC